MTTKKNILNAIDRYAFEWQLDSKNFKAIFQDLFVRLDNLDKKVDGILAALPEKPAPADRAKLNKAIEMCEKAISDLGFPILQRQKVARPGKEWTRDEDRLLRFMKDSKKTYAYIAKELGRTPKAVKLRWLNYVRPGATGKPSKKG